VTLPVQTDAMDGYIRTHKTELTEIVLKRIQYALKNKLNAVKVFKFTDSQFIVTIRDEDYYENVNNIIDYYMDYEKYELCKNA
jgi:hypothetical protein